MPTVFTKYPGATQTMRLTYHPVAKTGTSRTAAASEMFNTIYSRSALGGAATDTTDTATALAALFEAPVIDSAFEWIVQNNDGSNDLTIVGGTGVTLVGTNSATVAHGTTRQYIGVITQKGPLNTIGINLYSITSGIQ